MNIFQHTLQSLKTTITSVIVFLVFSAPSIVSAQQAPIEWVSTYTQTAPTLDGNTEEIWNRALPLTVTVKEALGGTEPQDVILRALHTDDMLYVLAQWQDDTESNMRDPYLWNADLGTYERPTTPDDQFALEFPLEGELLISMLPEGQAYTADVWHWKAGRSNLDGWVDDKRHIISPTPVPAGRAYQMGGRTEIYVARPMDNGQESYRQIDPPTDYQGDTVPSYVSATPDGSQSDIPGKGVHDGSGWTLEMGRRFNTGYEDDAVLDPQGEILCAIAILDDELYWHHSVSNMLVLRFRR